MRVSARHTARTRFKYYAVRDGWPFFPCLYRPGHTHCCPHGLSLRYFICIYLFFLIFIPIVESIYYMPEQRNPHIYVCICSDRYMVHRIIIL